jgi:hypothetical protein
MTSMWLLVALIAALATTPADGGMALTTALYGYNCIEFGKYKGDEEYQEGVLAYLKEECEGKEKCELIFSHGKPYISRVQLISLDTTVNAGGDCAPGCTKACEVRFSCGEHDHAFVSPESTECTGQPMVLDCADMKTEVVPEVEEEIDLDGESESVASTMQERN